MTVPSASCETMTAEWYALFGASSILSHDSHRTARNPRRLHLPTRDSRRMVPDAGTLDPCSCPWCDHYPAVQSDIPELSWRCEECGVAW